MLKVEKGLTFSGGERLEAGAVIREDEVQADLRERLIARGILTPVEDPTPEAPAGRQSGRKRKTSPNPPETNEAVTDAPSEEPR